MKSSQVIVPWREGLHLRPAASLVKTVGKFRSSVWLRLGGKRADARSVLSLLMLAAAMGAMVDVEVRGDDEVGAIQAVEQVFSSDTRPESRI